MASRRCFALSVVEDDVFLDLPIETRLAYFYLGMHTDNDGFVGNPKSVLRLAGLGGEALEELEAAGFITSFDSGVVHVAHFFINNTLRKDRGRATQYQAEKAQLCETENGVLIRRANQLPGSCQPIANQLPGSCPPNLTQPKGREGNPMEGNPTQAKPTQPNPTQARPHAHAWKPPTLDEVKGFAAALPNRPDALAFYDSMQRTGWPCGDSWPDDLEEWEGVV